MHIYRCEKCPFTTNKKTDFNRHLNRKIACDDKPVTIDQVGKRVEELQEKIEDLTQKLAKRPDNVVESSASSSSKVILNLVQNLHDLMRTKAAITGQKAYYDIIRLLLLKFMEPYMSEGGKLEDMLNPEHYENIPDFQAEDVKFLLFNNLADESVRDRDFDELMTLTWNMLSLHSFTEKIFPKNKAFNCPEKVLDLACQHIHKALENVHFDQLNEDIGGAIYEHFVNKKGGGGGQSLGQYFTPRKLINLTMQLNKEIFVNHKDPETIYDPCAGTAGFLMEMFKTFKIEPENVFGGELEPDTFANGLMNLMLTTGSLCNLTNGDSLKNNSLQLYDWIGTNPPFGVKGLKHAEICNNLEFKPVKPAPIARGAKPHNPVKQTCITADKMYPIDMTDGSALFLQHCIAKLAYGGRCNIVLPAGQLLTGKNKYAILREYLVKECILYAVLAVPGGVFDNAGVATVVLFFSKSKSTCTEDIDFYETDKSCVNYTKVGTVHSEELVAKNYALDWKYYKQVDVFRPIDSTWEVKTLGEVCAFVNGKKHNVAEGSDEGSYPLLCSSTKGKIKYLETYDYDGPYVAVGTGGAANVHLKQKFNISTDFKVLKVADSEFLNLKYLYIYLTANLKNVDEMFRGQGLKHLDLDAFKLMKIPIPSLEKQQEIIARCAEYDANIQNVSDLMNEIENNKQLLRKIYVEPLFKSAAVKTLGEVCTIEQGTYIKKENKKDGPFPIYGGGDQSGNINQSNSKDAIIVSKDGVSENCVRYVTGDFFLNHHAWKVKALPLVLESYLKYFLLSIQPEIYALASGAAQKGINQEQFKAINIPVPSLEKQEEVIKQYDITNNTLDMFREMSKKIEEEKNEYLISLFDNPASSN